MGSDEIAVPLLDFLVGKATESVGLAGVFTQPDRPTGRGRRIRTGPVKQWAEANKIEVRQPARLTDQDVRWLSQSGCELLLVMAYGLILQQSVLDLSRLGAVNFHASLLPAYRGAAPIEAAIANGDERTGVTLMQVVRRLDAGPLIDCEELDIDPYESRVSLRRKVSQAAVPLLRRNLPELLSGEVKSLPQDEGAATYTRLLRKEDGVLDFREKGETLVNRIRALRGWPGTFFEVDEKRLKMGSARFEEGRVEEDPGTVVVSGEELKVACDNGYLEVVELQRPGGRMLPADEFLRGYPIENGIMAQGGTMAPLSARGRPVAAG